MSANSITAKRSARKDKFKYAFELKEEQIGINLSHYFGILQSNLAKKFRLESSHEAETGADYEYQGIQARYYLQAKAPIALMSPVKVPIASGKASNGLNAIRAFRSNNNLVDEPYSLCFGLRKPAKNAKVPEDLQHNLLYGMNNPDKNSHAMYVAPTTYSKQEYLELLEDTTHWPHLHDGPFWRYRQHEVKLAIQAKLAAKILIDMPFLQAHICITPHATVTTHDHHYSYSVHANDVAFHSPTVLDGVSWKLSDFLASQALQLRHFETQSTQSVLNSMKEFLPKSVLRELDSSSNLDPLSMIRQIGRVLRDQYGIIQYLVTKRKVD